MLIRTCAAMVVALQVSIAWSQSAPPAEHGVQHPVQAARPIQSQARSGSPVKSETVGGLYDLPFADYRPFKADEPMKDWRKANDEVREAGGHIGLMKGEPAQLTGHGAHGAKQPTPPAKEKK